MNLARVEQVINGNGKVRYAVTSEHARQVAVGPLLLPTTSVGLYRSERRARAVADRWNHKQRARDWHPTGRTGITSATLVIEESADGS